MADDAFDQVRAEELLSQFLEEIGFVGDPELDVTAERVTEFLRSMRPGTSPPTLERVPTASSDPVMLTAIPFHSLCAHHLLPFFGEATVAIMPSGEIAGFGGVARVIASLAARPQIQERLTAQIAEELLQQLNATAVVVELRARQLCMEMRGAKCQGASVTFASRGDGAAQAQLERFLHRATLGNAGSDQAT